VNISPMHTNYFYWKCILYHIYSFCYYGSLYTYKNRHSRSYYIRIHNRPIYSWSSVLQVRRAAQNLKPFSLQFTVRLWKLQDVICEEYWRQMTWTELSRWPWSDIHCKVYHPHNTEQIRQCKEIFNVWFWSVT